MSLATIGPFRGLLTRPRISAPPPALGTPTFVAIQRTHSSGDINAAVPAGISDGQLLLAAHITTSNVTLTSPGGWTLFHTMGSVGSERIRLFWRVASSEPATYLFDITPSAASVVFIAAYSGCNTTSPIDGTPTENTGTSATVTATGLTTSFDNTMLVEVAFAFGNRTYNDGTATIGNERGDQVAEAGTGPTAGFFDGLQASAGASGNKTVTMSSSAGYGACMFGLKPSGS